LNELSLAFCVKFKFVHPYCSVRESCSPWVVTGLSPRRAPLSLPTGWSSRRVDIDRRSYQPSLCI